MQLCPASCYFIARGSKYSLQHRFCSALDYGTTLNMTDQQQTTCTINNLLLKVIISFRAEDEGSTFL
jgi:hypothetical protein